MTTDLITDKELAEVSIGHLPWADRLIARLREVERLLTDYQTADITAMAGAPNGDDCECNCSRCVAATDYFARVRQP